jgi:hypothetical protein
LFLPFLYQLRAQGLRVGVGEHQRLLDAMARGLIVDLDGLYTLGRALICRSEADFDAWDLAFAETFKGVGIDPALREKLERWLAKAAERASEERVDPAFSDEELWDELRKRLAEQKEEHHGGNRWVGTGGTSPFGHSGRAARGIRVGGPGGGRSAVAVADARQWEAYRTDHTLDSRDWQVALRTLRRLVREGLYELDVDATIDRTAKNAGDVEIVERRARQNQVRLVLMLDVGGSMTPHAQRVQELFTAVERDARVFRSLDVWCFHNAPYGALWADLEAQERVATADVLAQLGPQHRVIWVGDASMAPYELFSASGWGYQDQERLSGLEWIRRFKARCPASVWLNPDPERWWDHPTVAAIGETVPMFELHVDGLRRAVAKLRAPV